MDRPWQLRPIDDEAATRLARELGIHPATARCLVGRGLEDAGRAGAFWTPKLGDLRPPVGMAGFRQAVDRLLAAVTGGEKIGIFGDYDVDGVTTTALLTTFLASVAAPPVPRVARRDAGYGFGVHDAIWFAEQGCRLIVTVDCGTSDVPAILAARERGLDVIVVDHHQVPEGSSHPAVALLNPHHPDSTYPFRGLCSVGLGFFVAASLRTALKAAGWFAARPEPDVKALLDLVAVGTIADMAPLVDENRVLVTHGLRVLGERRRPGLAALLARAGVEQDRVDLDEVDVGWKLGPRLNAPGRLGDARPALDLLLAASEREAAERVAVCEELNERRKLVTGQMMEQALADAASFDDAAIVVARRDWHPGVAGIVAAKLVERFGKPAAVIAIDAAGEGRGSVRSVGDFDLVRALSSCRDLLVRFGGHRQAAGLTVVEERVADLRAAFARAARDEGSPRRAAEMAVDAELPLGDVDQRLAAEFRRLAPFGPANLAPIVAAPGARITSSRRVGEDGSHLKLTLECGRYATSHNAIAFRMADRDPGVGATVHLAYCPGLNQWRGQTRIELRVLDFLAPR